MSAPNRLRVRVPSNFSMRETRRLSTIHTMRRFRGVSRYQHANPTRALANTLSNSSGPSVADKSRERPSFATTSLHSLSIIDRRSNFKAPTCFTGRSAKYHSTPLSWLSAEGEEAKSSEDATTEKDDPQIEDASTTDDSSNSEDDTEPSATDIVYNIAPSTPLSEASQNKVQAIFEKVLWLDMIEVHLLTQVVNEQMGISWKETEMRSNGGGFVQASASGGGGASVEAEAAEEKTIFDLKLIGFDAKAKIKVIKEVRTIAGLGLKEAKEMVEGTPKVIQKELKLDKAEELKAQLEAVGAQVELV